LSLYNFRVMKLESDKRVMCDVLSTRVTRLVCCMQAMQTAGIEGQQVVLLLEDHQFVDPQFLELTNSLLSAGEVPGLYTPEELEPLLAPIKDQASDAGFRGTIAQYFASRKYRTIAHLKEVMCQ